jgi:hypothetical protein
MYPQNYKMSPLCDVMLAGLAKKYPKNCNVRKANWPIYVGNHDNSSNKHSGNTSATTSNQPSSNPQPPVSTTMSHPPLLNPRPLPKVSAKQFNNTTTRPPDDNPPDVWRKYSFPLTEEYLLEEYSDVFTGVGCFPGDPYHIEMIPDAVPVQHAPQTSANSIANTIQR